MYSRETLKFLPAFLLLSSSILSGAGCASAVGSSPEVGVAEASVVGGWQGRDQELYSTVEVRSRQPSYGFCTGTLIARRLVLTAGHCVSDMDDEGELELTPPSQIQVGAGYLRSNLHQEGQVVSVERIILHDAFDGEFLHSQRGGDASGMGHPNDLALLVLSQPITVIEPASVLDHDLMQQILSPGTIGLVSGYGVFDFDAQRAGTLYLAEASIDRVAPTEILTDGDFGDTCFGDSGGPLYLPHEGRLYVAGVVSRGRADVNVDCGAGGIYTLTSAYGSWIRKHAERELEQSELEDTGTDWERLGSAAGNLDAYINSVTGNPPGCSASPVRTDSAGFGWFAFAALGLLVHRHRRR